MKKISTFYELHEAFTVLKADKRWVFRGHASNDWELIPKAGRKPYNKVSDKAVFDSWKRRAVEYLVKLPNSVWDWLAIAQHHGLATRLLDWTTNPLNAAFFAVREQIPGDAIIYAVQFRKLVKPDKDTSPFDFSGIGLFYPTGFVPRITRQGGLFTVHQDGTQVINKEHKDVRIYREIVISESYRKQLLSDLAYYGVSSVTLFPDLEGLSQFINWTIETGEYFSIPSEKLFE